ncbi:MAG: PBSX family phage terminase large subunit [Thermoproteota archaeon]|nr:MAG: PBSX family phage terminase large subunit [Candidatus Korarchaeota archaeon]
MVVAKKIEFRAPISLLPKQLEALDAILKKDFIVYSGAVAAGKTLLLAHASIRTCINNPGCKGIIGSLTYTQLSNVVFTVFKEEVAKYQEILKENDIDIKLIRSISESHGKMKITFYNGSIIYFLSMDKEEKLRGYTIDFFCLDEPIEIDVRVFEQLLARMRGVKLKHRFALLTTNPGAQTHWIYKKFYESGNDKYIHIDTNSYENIFLPEGYIENMEASYDEDWKRRFLNGEWGAFEGQIYKGFDPGKHVISLDDVPYKELRYKLCGVDWGVRNPSCILVIGVTKDKKVYVIDEWYKNEQTTVRVTEQIKRMDKKYDFRKVYIDPSAADLILQCEEVKLPVEKADNHVEPGIGKVKSLFDRDSIRITSNCSNLIRELQAYRYDRDRTGVDPTEKPIKKDDHSVDALRYGVYSFKLFKRKIRWLYNKSKCEDY